VILERVSGRDAKVLPVWKGLTVACLATGPSLNETCITLLKTLSIPCIAVNDAYLLAPFAKVAYFADEKWWHWHKDREEWKSFAGEKCSLAINIKQVKEEAVSLLKHERTDGLSTDPTMICTGSNSGYQALNIATLTGAARVLLVGYDCRDVGGKAHFFGDHPDKTKPPYDSIIPRFHVAAKMSKSQGVRVINCTPNSAIDAFERGDLESVLATA
jgi:hypothetical protein